MWNPDDSVEASGHLEIFGKVQPAGLLVAIRFGRMAGRDRGLSTVTSQSEPSMSLAQF